MLYVKMCDIAMDLFSRRYFKDYFFMPLIDLSGKPVWINNKRELQERRRCAYTVSHYS
jgi:hypothetical protein